MFGKITKQINGLIAPQTIARVRDQRALQHVFASYHTLLLQQRAADGAGSLLAAVTAAAPAAPPQPKRARSTAAADAAAFRRAVDAALAAPVPAAAAAAAAAATALGAHPSPATSTLSSASSSPSPLVPGGAAPVAVHAEQKMSLSLAPRDEASRAVVARCGFTPFLVLTFKMARRTLGSIVQHLALKWFSGVRLRTLPAAHSQHEQQQQAPRQDHGSDRPHKPRKPAAVRYGMGRITLVLQHSGSGAVVGSWDRRNSTLFSDFVPTLPTSISAPVLASPDTALPVLYTIAGIAPDDVLPLAAVAPPDGLPLQQQPQQQQQQQQSAAWREQSDSIPQFHSFGRPTPSPPPPPPPPPLPLAQEEEEGEVGGDEDETARARTRRGSDGRAAEGAAEGAAAALEGGELNRLGDDAGGVVHMDKSFTSFVLESADAPGAALLRAGAPSSQFPSPLRAGAALAPSAQATPQTPMRALFSTSAACSPAALATPTFASVSARSAIAAASSSVTPSSGGGGGTGSSSGLGTPERLPFFASVVCALPGDAGASRDGLPKEDSQLALFPERSLGYSNPGLPFLAGAGGSLGLGVAMGSAAAGAGGAGGFPLFSGGTLNGADNSNF